MTSDQFVTLTKQQKATLSPEYQALVKAGLVRNDLTLTDAGMRYVTRTLFTANFKLVANQAIEDIKEVEEDEAQAVKETAKAKKA